MFGFLAPALRLMRRFIPDEFLPTACEQYPSGLTFIDNCQKLRSRTMTDVSSRLPETLGHYRVGEKIGEGGIGEVYRSRDLHLPRDVAIKVLHPGRLIDDCDRKQFRKEALALSALNHPNIATILDFDTQGEIDFLVEEFIEGMSLESMLSSGPLPDEQVVKLGLQIARGLKAAHEHGVIHRDLKPGNCMVTPEGHLKILDFGLARVVRLVGSQESTLSVSESVRFAGTPAYMAPEQVRQEKSDARTDIWAFGCVLFEMATGRCPFLGKLSALFDSIRNDKAPTLGKLNPKASAGLNAVVQKCLEKDPARRYQSADEVAEALRRVVTGDWLLYLQMRWKRWVAVVAIGAASIGIVGGLGTLGLKTYRAALSAPGSKSVPYQLYLTGSAHLERWDKRGELRAAVSDFEQAVERDPNFALGFSGLAKAYWAMYRLEKDSRWAGESEKYCGRAAALQNELPDVYVTLSRVHSGKGQYNLALQEAQHALKLAPNDPDAMMSEADVLGRLGRTNEAEEIYKRATALRPKYWDGYYELGVFYFLHQRYAEAATEFQKVLELTPDNAMVMATLGGMLYYQKKDAEAERCLKKSIELQPGYAAYTNLSSLYYRQKRFEDSAETSEKALAINSTDWNAWDNLGLAYMWLERKADSDRAFRKELERLEEVVEVGGGDDPDIEVQLGVLYSKFGEREKAIANVEAALARTKEDPSVLARAGEAYNNVGQRERALELVRQALEKGWTMKQLENDPGQQEILRDPRFQMVVKQLSEQSPARK
jgi:eukaryotic-like serine/threonine-protein kinase